MSMETANTTQAGNSRRKGRLMASTVSTHSIISVQATASEPGALDGYEAVCSCGYHMSHLWERDAQNLGRDHVHYMNRKAAK